MDVEPFFLTRQLQVQADWLSVQLGRKVLQADSVLTDPESEKKRLSVEECCRLIGNLKKRSEPASSKLTLVGKPALQFYRTMSALHTRANIGRRLTPGLTLEQRNAIVVELENTILAQMKPMVCGELSLDERMHAYFDQNEERRRLRVEQPTPISFDMPAMTPSHSDYY